MTDVADNCPGCGAVFQAREGPIHRYMISSPACWYHYGELLAAEYSDNSLMPTHRLSVDTYAIQHPGDGSRQAIQSVGLHLARLMMQLESPMPVKETNDVMLRMGARKATLLHLERPQEFSMTLACVIPSIGTDKHATAVRSWATKTFNDWRQHHDYIKNWITREIKM